MKNLIRTNSSAAAAGGGELDRNPNLHMQYTEFDHRSLHDHPMSSGSQCPPGMEHQQHLFACVSGGEVGPHMLPLAARSFTCSQSSGMGDYPSETIKHHCKCEKHDEETGENSNVGKCQIHSNNVVGNGPRGGGAGILVKTEFNEMQQSKSSPVREVFEMTSNAFTSNNVLGGNSASQFHHDHHDSASSPPLPLMESTNTPSNVSHLNQHHQCSPHSYESYLYATSSGASRAPGMSPRQAPGTMSATSGSGAASEVSGTLFHCKSFFADSSSGSPGIAAFYSNNNNHHQLNNNGESGRGGDDSSCGYSSNARDSEEKVIAKAIKARKMSD